MKNTKIIDRDDYLEAIAKAAAWIERNRELPMGKLEQGLINVGSRLSAQMHTLGLLRRGYSIGYIAEYLGVLDPTTVGRYRDGKLTPKPQIGRKLEDLYLASKSGVKHTRKSTA